MTARKYVKRILSTRIRRKSEAFVEDTTNYRYCPNKMPAVRIAISINGGLLVVQSDELRVRSDPHDPWTGL